MISGLLEKAARTPKQLSAAEIERLLACTDHGFEEELFAASREVRAKVSRTDILPRGLIETSNICAKDCCYCGIRKSNSGCGRYRMTLDEIAACVDEARQKGFPAVAFQAGEIESEANTAFYEEALGFCSGLEVTLSLGEQTESVYCRWKDAGALRYLIRIETSDPDLYSRIHPKECSFTRRVECIRTLKRLGYVTGSGVMIGIPGQTIASLARDVVFFGAENLDMVGMGPYIEANEELRGKVGEFHSSDLSAFQLSLRMIAVVRLYLQDVNIVAATALDALDPEHGRERGIAAGANVVMPNLTPAKYRGEYKLYPGKTTA